MPEPAILARVTIRSDLAALLRATDPAPILDELGSYKVSRMIRGLRTGGAAAIGQPPVSRRGAIGFAGRFTHEIRDGGQTLRYGNTSIYARVLHFGALGADAIKPVKAKALTIPIHHDAVGHRARDFPDLFLIPPRPGAPPEERGILARRKGRGRGKDRYSEIVPMYALRTRAEIQPHPYGLPWDEADNRKLERILQRRFGSA